MKKLVMVLFLLCSYVSVSSAVTPDDFTESSRVRSGVWVHAGCGTGELIAGLNQPIVIGLDSDAENITRTRKLLGDSYGQKSGFVCSFKKLPFDDNLVNVLIISENTEVTAAEALRVTAPLGIVFLRAGEGHSTAFFGKGWKILKSDVEGYLKAEKLYPAGMSPWYQDRYDASQTGISEDSLAGPAKGYKWIQGPFWSPSFRPVRSMVAGGGRIFYLKNSAVGAPSPEIECRDAFNGLKLWERKADPGPGVSRLVILKEASMDPGPAHTSNPIITDEEYLYTRLTPDGKVVALDGATGKTVRTYGYTGSITYYGGCLIIRNEQNTWTAIDPETEKVRRTFTVAAAPENSHLIAADDYVYLLAMAEGERSPRTDIVCFNFTSGKEIWRTPNDGDRQLFWVRNDVVLTIGRGEDGRGHGMSAYSSEKGTHLWNHITTTKKGEKPSAFYLGDKIWAYGKERWYYALKPLTGELIHSDPGRWKDFGRCGPDYATEKYILGMDFSVYEMEGKGVWDCFFARADCGVGYIPANGCYYSYGHQCRCGAYLTGIMSLECRPYQLQKALDRPSEERLEKGKAFGLALRETDETGWGTYRGDFRRDNSTAAGIPVALKKTWEIDLGPTLTSVTAGMGMIYAAVMDRHQITALDQKNGKTEWTFTASARIDTPPTIYRGYALFGARDGYVYCLDAATGNLVWKFQAAPEDRLISVRGQLESQWPVFGAVLVENGLVYCAAGRHGDAAEGMFCYGLDPGTGEVKWKKNLKGFPPYRTDPHLRLIESRKSFPAEFSEEAVKAVDPGLVEGFGISTCNEILQSDGQYIFLGETGLNLTSGEFGVPAGMCYFTNGRTMLADNTMPTSTDRNLWFYTGKPDSPAWRKAKFTRDAIKGNLIISDGKQVYGVLHQYSKDRQNARTKIFAFPFPGTVEGENRKVWNKTYPLEKTRVKALIAAGDYLYAAVQPGGACLATMNVDDGALYVHDKNKGKITAVVKTGFNPLFDGMSSAYGKLFISGENGKLACFTEETNTGKISEILTVDRGTEVLKDGVLRVICGAVTSFRDTEGNLWKADQEFEEESWGYEKGGIVTRNRTDIPGTDLDMVYLTEHYDVEKYRITVPNGSYTVRLHFAETYRGIRKAGERVFDVTLEGKKVLEGFDPFKEAGNKTFVPVVRSFEVSVNDGELTIGFEKTPDKHGPLLNGLEVIKEK